MQRCGRVPASPTAGTGPRLRLPLRPSEASASLMGSFAFFPNRITNDCRTSLRQINCQCYGRPVIFRRLAEQVAGHGADQYTLCCRLVSCPKKATPRRLSREAILSDDLHACCSPEDEEVVPERNSRTPSSELGQSLRVWPAIADLVIAIL